MSAATIAGRVAGPVYLSGSMLGTAAAAALGAGASRVAVDAEEHAPRSDVAAVLSPPMTNAKRLTLAP